MSKSVKSTALSVIDIGSNELRLRIAQDNKGVMRILESLSYPMSLGRDTYNTGRISFEKLEKTCGIIQNFLQVSREYGAKLFMAVATSAVREAENREYILDQIKIKTGVKVHVLDDSQEKVYIYKLMGHLLQNEQKKNAMMVYTGSGNIGLSVWKDGRIPFAQNIRIGSLRISEMFEDIQEYSSQFYKVVEEFLESFTDCLEGDIPPGIHCFVASGQEIAMISNLCKARRDGVNKIIDVDRFHQFYEENKRKTGEKIANEYQLPLEQAEILLPAMCIYRNLLEFTSVKEIITPVVYLADALMFEALYEEAFGQISKEFIKSTVLSAKMMAQKFHVPEAHYATIERFSLNIFDKMRKIHGMGKEEKLLLQTAAILHDIGKFIDVKQHYTHSFNIIQGVDIVGLSNREREIVANLALYHSRITPKNNHESYGHMPTGDKVLISKLAAILRIADALDRSHTQKFKEIDVKISDGDLLVSTHTNVNTDLEEWAFKEKSAFFGDVFGIKAILQVRKAV